MRELMGLNKPIYLQYIIFVKDAASGHFGESFMFQVPASEVLLERLPATLKLTASAAALMIIVSIPLGILAAVKRGSKLDLITTLFATLGQSIPNFWLGIMAILIFSLTLYWLPVTGMSSWKNYILPTITLGAPNIALITRLTRSSMLEVLQKDYVRTAYAKGLKEWIVVCYHAFKNASLPIVTVLGLLVGTFIGGAVITETIFGWPGIGQLVVQSIERRDFPILQAVLLMSALAFVVINLLLDLLYKFLDPRIEY
jgi:ABC-type dipeptide/oligopeptide/nickel transport system permease component